MRLGGPIFERFENPDQWVAAVRAKGYRAAYCPVGLDADDATIEAYRYAAVATDIVIAEVGAWSNPLSLDRAEKERALAKCRAALSLADRIGARCAVNIAGSLGRKWDGPCARDLTEEAFELIVESVRGIIDAVEPVRACYTLEPMPWMFPDSTESYERLLRAVDRDRFAVHFDPVNLVNCPERFFRNAELVRGFVERLGARISCCHAKDIALGDELTVHLQECQPGKGHLDYGALLTALDRVDPEMPLLLEHLPSSADYDAAAAYVRSQATAVGVSL
jgi:sugar phosphate isomerase/epimerase